MSNFLSAVVPIGLICTSMVSAFSSVPFNSGSYFFEEFISPSMPPLDSEYVASIPHFGLDFEFDSPYPVSPHFCTSGNGPITEISQVNYAESLAIKAITAKRRRWFNGSIDSCGKKGYVAEALELLQDMITAEIEPEDITLLIVALACIAGKQYNSAISILEIMNERGIVHSDIDVYYHGLTEALKQEDTLRLAFLSEDIRRVILYPYELRSIETEWLQVKDDKY